MYQKTQSKIIENAVKVVCGSHSYIRHLEMSHWHFGSEIGSLLSGSLK